ncbi:MAG: hypothetical protein MJA32_00600, partial [Proteobacteria bacterium]|nr:hypothetical protein [Pseudomonadota bacterium]
TEKVAESLLKLRQLFRDAFADLAGTGVPADERTSHTPIQAIDDELGELTRFVLEDLYSGDKSTRNTSLMLGIVLEMRDLQRELKRAAEW